MDSTIQNKRSNERIASDRGTVKIFGLGEGTLNAAVLDESFGGIGIATPFHIKPGTELDVELSVELGGIRNIALVRHAIALPSGCRIGLEWRASALSRHFRELLSADESNEVNNRLSRILPGGLSVMWKLFEARRWLHLLVAADRLRKEAAACHCYGLGTPVDHFQNIVRESMELSNHDEISDIARDALETLIRECVRAVD